MKETNTQVVDGGETLALFLIVQNSIQYHNRTKQKHKSLHGKARSKQVN